MSTKLTLEQVDALAQKLIDLEVESILQDRDALMELLYNHVTDKFDNYDEDQILELAEYHGVEVE